eukprot:2321890-Alexandrium_andersonii.AAC.1
MAAMSSADAGSASSTGGKIPDGWRCRRTPKRSDHGLIQTFLSPGVRGPQGLGDLHPDLPK